MPQPSGKRRGEHLFWRDENKSWYGWINVPNGDRFKQIKRSMGTTEITLARARLQEWERDSADPSATARKGAKLGDAFDLFDTDRQALITAGKRSDDSKSYFTNFQKSWLLYAGRLISRTPKGTKDNDLTQDEKDKLRTTGREMALQDVDRSFRDGFIAHRRTNEVSENTISKHLGSMKATMMLAKVNGLWTGDMDVVFPTGFSSDYEPTRVTWTHAQATKVLALLLPHRKAQAAFVLATGAEERAVHNALRAELKMVPVPLHGEKTDDRERSCFVALPWQKELLKLARAGMDGENIHAFSDWANSCRDLEEACLASNVPYASLHGLRHIFASWALDDGISMNSVAKALGHRDLRQLMRVYDSRDPKVIQRRAEQEAADRRHRLRHVG